MNFLLSFLTISLIIFVIYNLKIISLSSKHYIFLLLSSYIIIVLSFEYEKLGLILLLVILTINIYIKTRKFILAFIIVLFSLIIVIMTDTLSSIVLSNVFTLNTITDVREDIVCSSVLYTINFIISYFLCYLVNKLFNYKVYFNNITFKKSFNLFAISSLILTFLIFYINSVLFSNDDSFSNQQLKLNLSVFLLYFILLIIIYYILYKNVKKEAEFINRENEFENLKEYTQNIESLYSEIRKFKHDYVNILLSMSEYIEQNDMNGMRKYFEENISSLNKDIHKENFKLDLLQNINILELKGVISSKVIMCHDKGIHVHIDILEPIEHINMNVIDLCRVVGILLDNAIEESEKTSNKSIEIGLINKNNSVIIIITNSCSNEIPPMFKIYESGFSTKGDNRGLGLSNLKEVLYLYKNISIDTSFEDSKFIQILKIQN